MARRASSSSNPLWILLVVVLLLAAVAGGHLMYSHVSDPYRTMTNLPVQDYLDNANSLRGNVYKLEGTVAKSLEWSSTEGRLFSVEVNGNDVVPVLVPSQFNQVNIERGQRFIFKIEVGDKGILRAQDVKKA
jgi:flagellar basal body-associated protein FliL